MKRKSSDLDGSTLVVTIIVVAALLVLLGTAVEYTTQVSRTTERNRKIALATEIADGHLEALFTNWRNIYRATWKSTSNSGGTDNSLVGTNYFYTSMYSPGPAPTPVPLMSPAATPPQIALPAHSNFPTDANYSVTQYRIQAIDPMITLDANENALVEASKGSGTYSAMSPAAIPPSSYGQNSNQFSYFYLAAADITVPALSGNVKAKVRRVFEKKFDQPWTYAIFFVDDLELQPSGAFNVTGPIHTNGTLYIGTSNFTAASYCEYGSDFVNGYSPKDPRYPGSGFTTPNFAKSDPTLTLSDCPPAQVSPFLPFGWNLAMSVGGGNANGGYHEIIERPTGGVDPLANVRYYSQPGYRLVINADTSVTITRINSSGTVTTLVGSAYNAFCANNGQGTKGSNILNTNKALYDAREGAAVKVTDVDVAQLVTEVGKGMTGWTGLLYMADAGATTYNSDGTVKSAGTSASVTVNGVTTTTTKRAFRLISGATLPTGSLTIVSENPVYIQGNYNTGGTPPSNSGTYTSPTASGYTRRPAAVIADSITVLSSGWSDSNSSLAISSRVASNTTVNAALVAGIVPSNTTYYSGGAENFIRLLENWSNNTLCYYGSMVELYASNQAIGHWNGSGSVYTEPSTLPFYYDDVIFSYNSPPGNLQLAAYLQQQRWYQVY